MGARAIELQAPAKLNVHLGIYPGRDERGYHRADSVMVGVALADRIRIERAERLSLQLSVDVGAPMERNTVWRAVRELCAAFGRDDGWAVSVEKHVPSQAGLGGASSDAAAALIGLCSLWGEDPLDERVVAVARRIGADVPFFLTLNPALLVGAGDVLAEQFPALPEAPLVLVRPDAGVSTIEAYREFDADPIEPRPADRMLEALRASDVRAVAASLYNNLEPAANRLAPVTAGVREWLEEQPGVLAAQLTGSGSCVFAFCDDAASAARIARDAQEARNWWSCSTTTVGAGAHFC